MHCHDNSLCHLPHLEIVVLLSRGSRGTVDCSHRWTIPRSRGSRTSSDWESPASLVKQQRVQKKGLLCYPSITLFKKQFIQLSSSSFLHICLQMFVRSKAFLCHTQIWIRVFLFFFCVVHSRAFSFYLPHSSLLMNLPRNGWYVISSINVVLTGGNSSGQQKTWPPCCWPLSLERGHHFLPNSPTDFGVAQGHILRVKTLVCNGF